MKQMANDCVKRISEWLLRGYKGDTEVLDPDTEALRAQMREEFLKLRDRGLPMRLISV